MWKLKNDTETEKQISHYIGTFVYLYAALYLLLHKRSCTDNRRT